MVIPFSHNPVDQEGAWRTEVFSEVISIHLARISGCMVISRQSEMSLEDLRGGVKKVGQVLITPYVIEGSVWKHKGEYRISV